MQILSLAAISLGLVNVGSGDSEVASIILLRLLGLSIKELTVTHSRYHIILLQHKQTYENNFFFQILAVSSGNDLYGKSRCHRNTIRGT